MMQDECAQDLPMEASQEALVSRMLAPLTLDEFVLDRLGREFLHLPGEPDKFAKLISWDEINGILERHRLTPPRFNLVRCGKTIPQHLFVRSIGEQSWLDAGKVSSLLDQGATLVLNYVDEAVGTVGRYSDALAQALCAHVHSNLYASWRRDSGLTLHWDKHDVIAVQVAGRKQWTVYRPTKPFPHRDDPQEQSAPEGAPVFDAVLEPGDLLYLPRGWWHKATPLDEPSLHLTFSLERPSAAGFLDWFVSRLLDEPLVRQDIPVAAGAAAVDVAFNDLKHRVEERLERTGVDQFVNAWRAERRARPKFSLPAVGIGSTKGTFHPATRIRLVNQRGLAPIIDREAQAAAFQTRGRTWSCSSALALPLARISAEYDLTLEDLARSLGEDERRELVRILQGLAAAGELYCNFTPPGT